VRSHIKKPLCSIFYLPTLEYSCDQNCGCGHMTLLTGSNRALFFSFLPPSSKLLSRLIFSEELGFCLRDLSAGTAALSGEMSHGTSTGVVQLTDLQRILSGLGQAPGSVSFITLCCLKNIKSLYTHSMWHLYSFISVSIFTVFCIPTYFRPYCFERNKALLSRSAELARAKWTY
jgi:hypothetical protein